MRSDAAPGLPPPASLADISRPKVSSRAWAWARSKVSCAWAAWPALAWQ
ncbi:hypothetical protein [Phenylobacterium sp. LjRoot219]